DDGIRDVHVTGVQTCALPISAIAAARSAYLAGFTATSNLEAGRRYGIPTAGTAAHAFTLVHDSEREAFQSQVNTLGKNTTLLVDTFDITRGIQTAIEVAGTGLGAIRIDSGDVVEYAIAALRAEPVDGYGVGTSLVTGSGAPTAGMVYKLVEVDGRPVAKRSTHKSSRGGRKAAIRRHKPTGTAVEEVIYRVAPGAAEPVLGPHDRFMQIPLVRDGNRVPDLPTLEESREHLRHTLVTLP